MEVKNQSFMCSAVFFFFLLMGLPSFSVSTTFISDDIFGCQTSSGRNLLQAKKSCSVNFEFQNYSIITDVCKGPSYPADKCCGSFKDFACPFADEINDLSTDCASTMFSYINLYGKYPPGLFASECTEGKEGLSCPDTPSATDSSTGNSFKYNTPSATDSSTGNSFKYNPSLLLIAAIGFLFLLFQ